MTDDDPTRDVRARAGTEIPPRLAELVAQLDEADAQLAAAVVDVDDTWRAYEVAVERAALFRARYDLAVARYEAERRQALP